MSPVRRSHALVLVASVLVASTASAVTPPAAWAPGEAALLARLVAPCCWNQTLDMHESPTADALRLEVHERLSAGERREDVEDDFAARYGDRVRAVPRGTDRRAFVGAGVVALLVVSGLLACLALLRLRRKDEPADSPDAETSAGRDAYDDRLDDELAALCDDGI